MGSYWYIGFVHHCVQSVGLELEKGKDLTQSYDKHPTLTEKPKKQRDNIKKRHQKLWLHTIADRLRTVS